MALSIVMSGAAAPGADPRTTTSQSSASYTTDAGTAVSFTFNGSYPVGDYSDIGLPNHLFVVNTGGLSITNDAPTSQAVGGYIAYGMMKNAFNDESGSGAQGWDGLLDITYFSSRVAYDASLNVAPSLSGNSAITLATGEEATFTKGIRRAGVTGGAWTTFQAPDGYVHLHVLTAYPQNGSIPPAISEAPSPGTPKKQVNLNDVDWTTLPSYTAPSSWSGDNYTDNFANRIPYDLGYFGAGAQDRRRTRIDSEMPNAFTNDNYAAEIVGQIPTMLALMTFSGRLTTGQRDIVMARILHFAMTVYGIDSRGYTSSIVYGGGAGQMGGVVAAPYIAAVALDDADLLAVAQAHGSPLSQTDWLDASDYTASPPQNKDNWSYAIPHPDAIGLPYIAGDSVSWSLNGRYNPLVIKSLYFEGLAAAAMKAGGGTVNGVQAMLNSGALGPTNSRAAAVAMLSEIRNFSPFISNQNDPGTKWDDFYDLLVADGVGLSWVGRPQAPNGESSNIGDIFSAGVSDGTITANVSSIDYSIATPTQTDASYSLDGYQWIEVNNTTDTISLTGLLKNAVHVCRWRRRSSAGTGPWSAAWGGTNPTNANSMRNAVTTAGTANSAAPVTSVAPIIVKKFAPNWWSDVDAYDPISGSVDEGDILACGVGYFNAAEGTPTSYSYQWKRNGSNIAGATNKKYTVAAADAGTTLTCERTATNASGSEVDTTAGVTVNA